MHSFYLSGESTDCRLETFCTSGRCFFVCDRRHVHPPALRLSKVPRTSGGTLTLLCENSECIEIVTTAGNMGRCVS